MKFHKEIDAVKAATRLEARGFQVEWIRRNYGQARESTWNIRLADGSEVHSFEQLEVTMPERTVSAIANEIDQVNKKITSLQADMEAQRGKLTELVREFTQAQSAVLLNYGMRLVLENARDGLPVSRRARGEGSASRSEAKTIRAWAADNGMKVPPRGAIPKEIHEAYAKAHPSG